MKVYTPDPNELKDGLTIELRFWSACFNEMKGRIDEGFHFYITKDGEGSYWADYHGESARRKILINEFTPAEASRIVKELVYG